MREQVILECKECKNRLSVLYRSNLDYWSINCNRYAFRSRISGQSNTPILVYLLIKNVVFAKKKSHKVSQGYNKS